MKRKHHIGGAREGSPFKIQVPLSTDPSLQRTEVVEDRRNIRGKETILVVEDEEIVRNLTVLMLQTLGYQTIQAAHGGEALEICRTFPEPIHLILTDMIMPQMSGKQFVEKLQKMSRNFKVLFVSGYSGDDTVDGKIVGVDMPFIQKPFTREALGRKIRELIDSK
jgi:CheY-like chemotaxis protein